MKRFKTLNIKQVMRYPLTSNYTIHGVSNPTCALHCTCTSTYFASTIQHNEPLMWSET